jgi:archaellin
MATRTTLATIIFTALIVVLASAMAVSLNTPLSAMTMQQRIQATMMNNNMSSGNMTSDGTNMTK